MTKHQWNYLAVFILLFLGPWQCKREPSSPLAGRPSAGAQEWPGQPEPPSEWTIMLYINGDNDLETAAINTYAELSRVGSSADVKVVAEVDRAGRDSCCGGWTDTRRFLVTKDMALDRDFGHPIGEQNMGDGKTLTKFVQWAQTFFPAKHYVLVMWGHGSGFAFAQATAQATPSVRSLDGRSVSSADICTSAIDNSRAGSLFKAALSDQSSGGDELLNGEAERALVSAQHIEIVGYDACLMQMLETAYAFRERTDFFVASEQLETAASWSYAWLAELEASRGKMTSEAVARSIVAAYATKYARCDGRGDINRTLSALRLANLPDLCDRVDVLSDALIAAIRTYGSTDIEARRNMCEIFGDPPDTAAGAFHSIDLVNVSDRLAGSRLAGVGAAAAAVSDAATKKVVIASFADHNAQRSDNGARGLAIYFPRKRELYCRDDLHVAYEPNEFTPSPVAFAVDRKWRKFLHDFYDLNTPCIVPPPPAQPPDRVNESSLSGKASPTTQRSH